MRIYLAGRITGSDWRDQLVDGLTDANQSERHLQSDRFAPLKQSVLGDHDYTGPFYIQSIPPGPWGDRELPGHRFTPEHPHNISAQQEWINRACLHAIDDAEVVFAWLDAEDLYGTLIEIGYAKAKIKGLWVAGPHRIPELWFAYQSAGFVTFRTGRPHSALRDCLLMRELGGNYGYSSGREGFVYILRAGPFYKIGRAKSIDNRLRQIKLQLPFQIELLHSIQADDCVAAESALHAVFRRQRANGEWFLLPDDDANWLCSFSDFLDIYNQD